MSRVVGFCLILGDIATTVATFVNLSSPSVLLGVVFVVLTSIAFGCMSPSIRSILWPTYFWDQPEPIRGVAPTDNLEKSIGPL